MKAIIILSAIVLSMNTHAQNLEWSHTYGGDQTDYVNDMSTDSDNNIVLIGIFQDTVDFDPSSDTFNIISQGDNDFFIQKLNENGELLWVTSFGFSDDDAGYSLAIDNQNNIYGVGEINDNITIIKLAPDGSVIWTKFLLGFGLNRARQVSVDPVTSDILVSSDFQDDITLDINGVSTTFSETTADAGARNILVTRLNPNGDVVWAEALGEDIFMTATGDCLFDQNGNMYIIGGFRGTCDFDPGADTTELTSMGQVPGWIYHDIFIQKLDPSGNFLWVKHLAGNGQDYVYDAEIAGNGLYMVGLFELALDFDPGPTLMNIASANGDGFILKLDLNGELKWVELIAGPHPDAAIGVSLDTLGNLYTSGYFRSTTDFGSTSATSVGNSDAFVVKMDTLGAYQNLWHMGGLGIDGIVALSIGNGGEIYASGSFEEDIDFDLSASGGEHVSNGMFDACVLKINESLNVNEMLEHSGMLVYPNPVREVLYIESDVEVLSISIFDMKGVLIDKTEGGSITVSDLDSGTYIVRISTPQSVVNRLFTKE